MIIIFKGLKSFLVTFHVDVLEEAPRGGVGGVADASAAVTRVKLHCSVVVGLVGLIGTNFLGNHKY